MFQMNFNEVPRRYIQFDGLVHYYKNGWLSNKWIVVYAKLWSDSTLEWFQSKGSDNPIGSILLSSVIPYICIGPQVRKVPSRKPRLEVTWMKELLMAIAMDQRANDVHWFYFDNGNNLRKWVSNIVPTLPRLNTPFVYPRQNNVPHTFDRDYDMYLPYPHDTMRMPREDRSRGINMSINYNNQRPKRRSSFDNLFNETFLNYGIGNFFFPMNVDDDFSSDSDEEDFHRHTNGGVTVIGDNNVHVSQFGDATDITFQSVNDLPIHATPHQNEFGSGFNRQIHRFEL
uniref:Uncharacterized protein n=1 Tax=Panagrolaimus superbus TaxID=310955 RepID=A0A914YMZ9_9BILA